jgi:hypothetical protein
MIKYFDGDDIKYYQCHHHEKVFGCFRKCYFEIITNARYNKGTVSELAFSPEAIWN